MRHQVKKNKLGRTQAHRNILLSNLVCSLIEHHRIETTLAKAKAMKRLAEKMITRAKKGSLHDKRIALAILKNNIKCVDKLFNVIAPSTMKRHGGYTRIIHLPVRLKDSAKMAFIEWVDYGIDRPSDKKKRQVPLKKIDPENALSLKKSILKSKEVDQQEQDNQKNKAVDDQKIAINDKTENG